MTNHKSKCGNGKCADEKFDLKDLDCGVTAEKNLLHLVFLYNNGVGASRRDVSATYEIVIFNRSCNEIRNVHIKDSFLGLMPGLTGSGEVRQFYTQIISASPSLFTNTYNQMVAAGGELLAAGSTVPARSAVSLVIRITGRGFVIGTDPASPTPTPVDGLDENQVPLSVQNTAVITGDICKSKGCGCRCYVPLFPIYVKSGLGDGIEVTRQFTVNPAELPLFFP